MANLWRHCPSIRELLVFFEAKNLTGQDQTLRFCPSSGRWYVHIGVSICTAVDMTLEIDDDDAHDFVELGSIELRFYRATEVGVSGSSCIFLVPSPRRRPLPILGKWTIFLQHHQL